MKVHDAMTESVRSCRPDTNLAVATATMWEADCGALPVVSDEGKVVGIITDRDIAIALGTRNQTASDIPVGAAMSTTVYSCAADDDIHTALKTMRKDRVRRLPVVNTEGVLEGILSMNDVVLHSEKLDGHKTTDLSYEDVVKTFKALCEHRHPKATAAGRQTRVAVS